MVFLIVLVLFMLSEQGISQSNFTQSFCGRIAPIHQSNFIKNRNATLAELRKQLLKEGVVSARAQDLSAGDTVYSAAECRNYLSTDQCVACFDAGVSVLAQCTAGNGAYVVFDSCFIRYEDFADYYSNPNVIQDGTGTPYSLCGNQSASEPITAFQQVVDGLLSDIRDATPEASNFYVALKREISSTNASVYAIGQCVGNKTACENCMNNAYSKLNEEGFLTWGVFRGHSSKVTTIAGTIGGIVLLLLIPVMCLWYRQRKKAKKRNKVIKQQYYIFNFITMIKSIYIHTLDTAELEGAVNYSYKDLFLATNNFCEDNVLGKGGFGEVFKAILDDKNVVAVKKLQVQHAREKEEFDNEVKLISQVHHRNLLRLLGWSSVGSDLLLVLEYMPNGSLDRFLWGAKRGTLDWNQRYEIIYGIARGLAHLHNEFHVKIIHRDIKSSNILLTDDFKPKIADFGLARFQPEDETHISTKFAGTLGYTAPEYALHGFLSDKVDTYSFGVVILEIISGRRSTEVKFDGSSSDYLLEEAWKSYEKKMHVKFIDETLKLNQYEEEQVMKITEIALRPTMSEVVVMLREGQSVGKRELIRPTFVNNHERRIHIGSSRNSTAAGNVHKQ